MYQNQKILIGILGIGVLLGGLGGRSFAAPGPTHTWNNGGEHKEESGISGDDLWLLIDNVTTLTGNVTVEQDGKGRLFVKNSSRWNGTFLLEAPSDGNQTMGEVQLESSFWKGNLQTQKHSTAQLGLMASEWQGNVQNEGISNIFLNRSQWTGNFLGKSEYEANNTQNQITLQNYSNWSGELNHQDPQDVGHSMVSYFIRLESLSSWNGDVKVLTAETPVYIDITLSNSNWTGNMELLGASGYSNAPNVKGYDRSLWSGNVDITNGGFSGVFSDQAIWNGNLTLRGKVSGSSVSASNNSLWIGDVDTTMGEDSPQGEFSLNLWKSQWKGKAASTGIPINVGLMEEATWWVTGDSQIRQLIVEADSEVVFVRKLGSFSTLTIEGDLKTSKARFCMNTDLAANAGDLLDVKGRVETISLHPTIHITVNNQGSAWVNPSNELTIVKTGGTEDDQFELDNEVEVGGFEYGLKRVGSDWNLYTTGRSTTTASASLNAFVGSYLLNYAENQTLLKRLGDLRGGSEKNGIWSRVYGGEFESRGNHFLRGFDMNYSGVQVGYDQKRGSNYFGGMFGYTKGNLDHGAGSGSVDSKSLGAYWTHLSPNGFYADFVLKYGWMNHDFKVLDSSGATIKGDDIDTSGWSGSLEVGKRIYLDLEKKDRWYLEPQAQLTISHQSGDSFTASNGLQIQVDSLKSVLGRIGLNVGYEVKSGKNPIHLYGKVSYLHEFEGDIGVSYNGIRATEHLGDSWWSYGIGATAQLGKNHRLYLDIERADGARFRQPWAMSGGYRFSW